jgi:hypothetical protein
MITKAYSPEQSAIGKLDNGRSVLILYVKEFEAEYSTVQNKGLSTYTYNWFHNPELNSYILQVEWEDTVHVAIRFEREHWKLLVALVEPTDVVLTASPISQLLSETAGAGGDFLDFSGPVVTFSEMVFQPPEMTAPVG